MNETELIKQGKYLSEFNQYEIQITKEQAREVNDAIDDLNSHMFNINNPFRIKIDDSHNFKCFFFYSDKINTEPFIVNEDGEKIFDGDICKGYARGVGAYCRDTDDGYDADQYEGINIEADKQPIHIFVDEKGILHAEMQAYGGSTGNEPEDGPAFEGTYDFEPEQITLLERK